MRDQTYVQVTITLSGKAGDAVIIAVVYHPHRERVVAGGKRL
jgi:hypothetical protein